MKLIYDTEAQVKSEVELNEATQAKKYVIKGIFSTPEVKNHNGRIYPLHVWEREVIRYQDVITSGSSNSLLELEHPPRTQVDMMEAVAKMRKLYIKDGKVMGEAVLLDNPKANQLKTLIDNGIKMSVSSRGTGTLKENIVQEYKLITFDIIPDQKQSDINASMMGITEGILKDVEYEVLEEGTDRTFTKICTKDRCDLYEKEEVQDAIIHKFDSLLETLT